MAVKTITLDLEAYELRGAKRSGLGPFVPDEEGSERGTIARLLATRTRDIAWSRPGARPFDADQELGWGGWFVDGEKERAFLYDPAVQLVVGQTYVGMMTYVEIPDEAPFWAFLSTSAVVSAEGGVVGQGDDALVSNGQTFKPGEGDYEVLDATWGHPVEDLVALLEATRPDAAAEPYMELPAVERYQRTAAVTS